MHIHAGWKGAFSGIIENTILKLSEMGGDKNKLIVNCWTVYISK